MIFQIVLETAPNQMRGFIIPRFALPWGIRSF